MNRQRYRLVFCRHRRMRVAVAEHARSTARAPGAGLLGAALLAAAGLPVLAQTTAPRPPVVFASRLPAPPAASLPQPVTSLFRDPAGRGAATVTAGTGTVGGWTLSADGKTATFDQGSAERVLLNWQSFDIAQGFTVRFLQDKDPSKYVSALNRVWGTAPSVIQGQLLADREVQLVNPSGVYFGASARVQAGRLVASALSVPDAVNARGIRNITDGSPVFTAAGTSHRPTDPNASVTVEAGAEISTAAGGDVLLVAPRVVNQGRISTPDGQTVLAAGDKVYLMSSSDPKLRGLIVAVDAFTTPDGRPDTTLGLAENSTAALAAQLNEIRADRGSVNIVGLTVRQAGTVNATTAVKGANGVVQLQAMATTAVLDAAGSGQAPARGLVIEPGARVRVGATLGTVELAAGSTTAVLPQAGAATQLDAEVFNRSVIRAEGAAIAVGTGAKVLAPAGEIDFKAARSTLGNPIFDAESAGSGRPDDSRIVVAPDAVVSAAGLRDVAVDGARNQGALRLFRIELADAPVQRDGPLYRAQVLFDQRDAARITAGNVSGAAAAVERSAAERSTVGGSVSLQTDGALVVGTGAQLDVSGGSVRVSEAVIRSSLLQRDGQVTSFRTLPAGQRPDTLLAPTQDTVVPAYTQGADGGTLLLNGRQVQLAGQAQGSVVLGLYQRDLRAAPPAPATLQLGSGSGSTYYLDSIALTAARVPVASATLLADPLGADTSGLAGGATLSLAAVARGGFGNLSLRATRVLQPEFASLDLGPRGSLDIVAGDVALDGIFSAAGGRISVAGDDARSGTVALSAQTALDAAGRWTNDTAAAASGAAPVQNDGGSVSVRSVLGLTAEPGARVDVSAGARLASGGGITLGKAGAVTLATRLNSTAGTPVARIDGLQLRGFDFSAGGRLAMTLPSVTFGGSAASGGVRLEADLLSSSGFGRIDITGGDLRVAAGTLLAPRLLNWQFDEGFRSAASGTLNGTAASPVLLDARLVERRPVSLGLAASRPLDELFPGGTLSVERGASILLEPGGALALQATLGIDVGRRGGSAGQASVLGAPGGSVSMSLVGPRGGNANVDPLGFRPQQAIWLGPDARVDVAGTALLRPDSASSSTRFEFAPGAGGTTPTTPATPPAERRVGTVLGGGTVTLAASRGYVVAEAGSAITLDGAAASLNLPGVAAPVSVAKPAGSLQVRSPEGIVLDGQVSAQPPRDAAGRPLADGGRLQLSLGAGGVQPSLDGQSPYPADPRELRIGTEDGELARRGARWGTDLSESLGNGTGWVRTSLLQGAGWASASLAAGDLLRFDRSLSLALPLAVQLDAPGIAAAPGAQVTLQTAYALLGDTSLSRQGPAPNSGSAPDTTPAARTGLAVRADTIDLVGNLGLQGFSTVALDAAQDLRLSAAAPNFGFVETRFRRVAFSGELRLSAGQIYATSGSQISLVGDSASQLVLRGAAGGAPALPPLTAFGAISASATDIDQGGVLRQPFGSITLAATGTLKLGAGSVTSVSGQGAAVLYGQTVNLTDWQLPGPFGLNSAGEAESKRLVLAGAAIETDPQARVSAAGGGSVLAWEFFRGVGGSRDRFDDAGVYAVLPDRATAPGVSVTGGLLGAADATRQFVVTMPGSGLAPGRYSLLPARAALLGGSLPQGAFLVSRTSDQGSNTLRAPIGNDDGSVVVTGYLASAGSTTVGTPGERFVVEPLATALARSDVRLTDISDLRQQRAAALGDPRPALPRDAGLVQVRAGDGSGAWTAALDLAAREGGQAGQLDMAATRLALLDDVDRTPAGALGVSAAVLGASGAGSVLLGGLRSVTDQGVVQIDTRGTQRVDVDLRGGTLRSEELLLAASGSVALAAGTSLQSTPTGTQGPRTLQTDGDGALLAVSANALTLQREGAALTAGRLQLGEGTQLAGRQVLLDATAGLLLPPSTRLAADALALGAPRLVVGDAAATVGGAAATPLNGALLDSLRSADALTLKAYDSIDFAGTQDGSARLASRLVLDAPLVRGVAAADGSSQRTSLVAQDVVLRNSSGLAAGDPASGSGGLLLEARPPLRAGTTGGLTIGPGALALGFDGLTLQSSGDIVLQGTGGVAAKGDVALVSARVTAGTGAAQGIAAGGELRLDTPSAARTLGERVGQGAALTLSGRSVDIGGRVDLPGGQLRVQAGGASGAAGTAGTAGTAGGPAALTLRATGVLAATGFVLDNGAGFVTAGSPGSIMLQADSGRIDLAGTLDVSAAGTGDGGSLRLNAVGDGGTLRLAETAVLRGRAGTATVGSEDRGGRIAADLARLEDAGALARAATAGGLDDRFALRVRNGDVVLDSSVQAGRIDIAADAGQLAIGTAAAGSPVLLNARQAAGGMVALAAGGDLVLGPRAAIDARGGTSGGTNISTSGGDVLLTSSSGRVRLDAAASIDASGPASTDGRIVLRALRGADNRSVQVDRLNPAQLRAGDVAVEAVRVYERIEALTRDTDDDVSVSQLQIRADNNAFMANRSGVLATLGLATADPARFGLRAGVEVRSDGDLRVTDAWNLAAVLRGNPLDRPGSQPGVLTLRAAGSLFVDATLNDGFTTPTGGVLTDNTRSWSLRLAGGADLGAANPLAVQDASRLAPDSGDLVLGPNTAVRTGAGSIGMAAARDIVLSAGDDGSPAQVLSAGRRIDGLADLQASLFSGFTSRPQFTTQGGRIELLAARDIVSAEPTQFVGNWLWRSAVVGSDGLYSGVGQGAWWTPFERFAQGVGAFGGGSVLAEAGRDLVNLQAAAPSAGYADSRVAGSASTRTLPGGTLDIRAGRDVRGGLFVLGQGTGRLVAGGAVVAAASNANLAQTTLGLMDGGWRVLGRLGVELGTVFQPTAAPVSTTNNRLSTSGYFYTWGSGAGLSIVANAGSVLLPQLPSESALQALGVDDQGLGALSVLPPSLSVTAAGGSVIGRSDMLLFPSATGRLRLWAGDAISLDGAARLAVSDTDPANWPSLRRPAGAPPGDFVGGASSLVSNSLDDTLTLGGLRAADTEPARLHADGTLAIRGATASGPTLSLATPAVLTAGDDIVELSLRTQHFRADDLTRIQAGRNLLALFNGGIEVVGPGLLDVSAGRGVDLGSSAGISTSGNLRNAALPAEGAAVRVAAATAGTLDLGVLRSRWLAPPEQGGSPRWQTWRALLLQTLQQALASPALDEDAALAAFAQLPAARQAAFGQQLLAQEFQAVYASGPAATEATVLAALRRGFDSRKADLLRAGEAALGAGSALTLPGREILRGTELSAYLDQLRALRFDSLDTTAAVRERVASLNAVRDAGMAAGMPGTRSFEQWRQQAVAREVASAGAAAASFGRLALPLRLALFDQAFAAAELGGIGSFVAQPAWPASGTGLLGYSGALDMTQSGIVTRRGGGITLLNPGGGISVGLKDVATGSNAPKGLIALGGGDVFGLARDDFQVNTQRVFIVGSGDMSIFTARGDIDSGRGANTAVAAPPLAPRRTADGVVFEVPATTTGSGLGILADAQGRRSGTIGLFPAFGEILALDAFIRAPAVVLSAPVKGSDNVQGPATGAGAVVAAPALALAPPPQAAETRAADGGATRPAAEQRNRNSLLTVELLGLGADKEEADRCAEVKGRPRPADCPPRN